MDITTKAIDPIALQAEKVIRDLAGTVVNQAKAREQHPSYGYTKTVIRNSGERLEGAIGLYMVLTNQAAHAGVPTLAAFVETSTGAIVHLARAHVAAL